MFQDPESASILFDGCVLLTGAAFFAAACWWRCGRTNQPAEYVVDTSDFPTADVPEEEIQAAYRELVGADQPAAQEKE